jgi:hypothetical protein
MKVCTKCNSDDIRRQGASYECFDCEHIVTNLPCANCASTNLHWDRDCEEWWCLDCDDWAHIGGTETEASFDKWDWIENDVMNERKLEKNNG